MAAAPPAPKNILRGHKAQIHAATFLRQNERLATGDADGFVVLWDLTIMRPRAVWKAHEGALLSVRGWGRDRIITHGRDHKLIVWKVSTDDEERLSVALPVEDVAVPRPQPWMLHVVEVNTMNFCSFAICADTPEQTLDNINEILVAVPNTLASEAIDIWQLPSQTRLHTVTPGKANGMAMCLGLVHLEGALTLIAAFENGYTSVHRLESDGSWMMTYRAQAHQQPVLSLDISPDKTSFLTSSADAVIAKHPIPVSRQESVPVFDPNNRVIEEITDDNSGPSLLGARLKGDSASKKSSGALKEWTTPLKSVNTKHAGQQSLHIRSDGRIFATAGWDSQIRVYSCKSLKELAVLSWHQVGCYATAFAEVDIPLSATESPEDKQSLVKNEKSLSVKGRRIHQAKSAHWIAAGAKDGKISLWDIY